MLVYHVPHAEHVESSIWQIGKVRLRRHHAGLHLSCSQVSEPIAQVLTHKLSPVTIILSSLIPFFGAAAIFCINYSVHA